MNGFVLFMAACLCLPAAAHAQWANYPGAQRDTAGEAKALVAARAAGITAIPTSPDSFDKVPAFYRSRAKEYTMPGRAGHESDLPGGIRRGPNGIEAIPSGIKVKQAFFIFDGAADLAASKDWMTLSRPSSATWFPTATSSSTGACAT